LSTLLRFDEPALIWEQAFWGASFDGRLPFLASRHLANKYRCGFRV